MHTKEYNGFEIKYSGPDLNQDEIDTLMEFLHNQIEEINDYPDRSLFFQNPQIIEGWLALTRAIAKIETWEAADDETTWETRTETYVAYLLALRDFYFKYQALYKTYYEKLKNLLDGYGGWLEGESISPDGIEALLVDQYEQDLEDVEDVRLFIKTINNNSHKARFALYDTLSDVNRLLMSVMNRGGQRLIDLKPDTVDFVKAIDNDLREWTFCFGKSMFKEMKEELNRHYKAYRTAPYTPELWGELLDADEVALNMAKRQELATCDDVKQEHWGEDMKTQMDENGKLMQLIYSSCRTDELFDLRMVDDKQRFISLLNSDNLSIFYDIIVRRNLIQCEMFPELKVLHEAWLNNVNEQPEEDEEIGLSIARQSKLDEIIGILQKGNWKQPATADNIELLLNTLFGKDTSSLEEGDEAQCERMWSLVEGGGGDRMVIMPANLAGYFAEENLLAGSPKVISNALFGNSNQVNNINKGNSNRCSAAFTVIIPFLKKYIDKIIRQV